MQLPFVFIALIALNAPVIKAHTRFTALFVNGKSQGDGTCVRMDMNTSTTTAPIADITSTDMTCGVGGLTTVNRTCPIQAGDTVSFRFLNYADGSRDTSIVTGHSGPCAVYMKQISKASPSASFPDTDPTGDGWFKIMYQDYDGSQWCTDKLAESSEGVISAIIPTDVAPGYYLLRPEVLALHAVSRNDPQFYPGCAQVYISGGSGTANPETTKIPGYVDYDTPAMKFNIYSEPLALPYPAYGPTLYKANSSNKKVRHRVPSSNGLITGPPLAHRDTTALATLFGCPANTVLELGNWCGLEVDSYTDTSEAMTNCWATSKQCWNTAQECWSTFSPAINNSPGHGCELWNDRCTEINDACEANVMTGPPNKGKVLTPSKATIGSYGIMKRVDQSTDEVLKVRSARMRRSME